MIQNDFSMILIVKNVYTETKILLPSKAIRRIMKKYGEHFVNVQYLSYVESLTLINLLLDDQRYLLVILWPIEG